MKSGDICTVTGKSGPWLETQATGKSGWVWYQDVRILGVAESSLPSSVSSTPRFSESRTPRRRRGDPHWRAGLAYGYGIKSIDNTFRLGLSYSLLSFNRGSTFDFSFAGAFFGDEKIIQFGPSLVNDLQTRVLGGRFNILTAMSIYHLSPEVGESDFAIGGQIGPLLKYGRHSGLVIGFPIESILFGATRTRVSFVPTLGFQF